MKLAGLWVLLLLAPLAVAGELKVIDFPGSVSGSQGGVRSVQWSPDGSKIVLSVDGRPQSLVVFETAGWSQVSSTTRYGSPDYVKWSPDGSKLLFEGVDSGQSNNIKGDLLIVDAASWTLLKNMTTEAPWDYIFAVAWSPDGRRVASGYGNGTFITWDASTGQALDNIGGHYDAIRSIEWSPDGSKIATSSDDGSAKIWNSALRGNILLVWFNNSDSDSSPAVNKAVWSHDGSKIAFASRDKAVRVWSVSPWVSLLNMSASSSVNQVAWSPDGSKIAYASYENLEYAESVHVWDINSKKEVSVLAGHAKLIHALEWSPDGKMIASSSWDGTARIWDVTNLGAGGAIGNGSCVPGWCFSAQEEVSWPDAYGSIVHTGAMVPGIMTQGTLFSGEPDTKVLVFPSPTHALNVRSNGAGGYLHEGNATSSPFNLTGDLIEWAQLDEAARLQFTFELLDASTGQVLITETTGGAPGQWYARTIDASEFAGRSVRIRFRQHTTDYGLGWYSLVDDVRTIKNGQPTSDVKNGNFESVASTGPGGGGDLIPVPGEVNVTFRFMTRETVGGKLLSATPQELQGQPLLGTREGDLVGFKPEGDSLVGHKVEWFDEWNGKKYKLDTLQSLRSLYSFNSTVKIGVFSDAARSVPLTSLSAGQTAYFRVSARDALTGKPAIVRGVIMVYYNNSNGTPGGAIYTLKFGVTEKRLADAYRSYGEKVLEEQIVGTYEDSFVLPQNIDSVENVSIALEIGGGLVVEGMVIAPGVKHGKHVLVLGGAASSGDWQGTYELDEDRARIFGVADDFVGVLRDRGIYRSFAPGSHKVSLFVDGKDKGSMVVDVEKLNFGKTADVGVVLVEYKGKRPNGCGDGRDRDGDGLTGYGRDDDCDGWDEYEYRNFLLSYANRFFHESTNGKLGFEWHLFDNGGKWFPLGEVSAAGSSGGGPWVEEIADQAIHAATGIKRSKWVEGKNDARVMVVLSDQSQSSDVGGSGTTTTRIGDMVILPYGHAVTHELGHGYGVRQELYPVSGDNWPDSDVDGWSVMGASSGALFDVYSRVRLGIASEDLKRRDGDYKLGLGYQSFGAFTVKSAPLFSYVSGHRYLVEARSKAPHLTYFDRSLPYSAVVVYDVYTAASFWDVVTANPLARVGDSFQSPDGGVKIELIKNNLDVDGTAEVRVKTSISSNVQGAIIDGASWLWGKLTGKSGPRSNESFDLDLHAYYTLGGSQHHVGMNYGTGEYEKPEGVLAGGDLVIGEWILVPKAAQNVEFKVVNKKLRDYFAKHPDQLELYPGETKFSITYLNFDGDGKRTVTNPQLSSISLDEQEKAFSMPAIGFLDQQTVERPTPETIKQRVIVLLETQSYEIAYSQEFAGESRPEIPEQAFSKPGNYTIVWQSAGPTNELYSNDELLRRNVIEFSNEAYVQKDNLVELQDRHMPEGGDDGTKPPDIVTAAGDSTLLFAGVGVAAVLVIVVVLVFVLRQRSAVPPA